jgi:hypothetical protein
MLLIACVAVSLILAVAVTVYRRRTRPSRTGAAVDYGEVPGTQMFDAELAPIRPSDQALVVDPE